MYCDKKSVNILTALLPATVSDVVVCPGSRNAVIVHNLNEMSKAGFTCGDRPFLIHPVTDERSAAFVALGVSLARGLRPVAVCVTSGSALLNTLPAVAEAYYRHIPLLIISADRPAAWIDQLDGQTLPQPNALMPYARTFSLPEPTTEGEEHWCRNIVSEALIAQQDEGGRPVHINVPLTEPLFSFTTPRLPRLRPVKPYRCDAPQALPDEVVDAINRAKLPALLVGQWHRFEEITEEIDAASKLLVLPEIVSNQRACRRTALLEEDNELREAVKPDLIIHVGGNLVGKQFKLSLRKRDGVSVVRISQGSGMPDTFSHLDGIVCGPWPELLRASFERLQPNVAVKEAKALIDDRRHAPAAADAQTRLLQRVFAFVKEEGISLSALHLANSTAVRSAARLLDGGRTPIHCNRGVNGIEGSLSAAVGYSLADNGLQLAVIGDLSFFYDNNALWNTGLRSNLRILLINNGGGRIFDRLPGLEASPAKDDFIAAAHHASARGLAETYNLKYIAAATIEEAVANLPALFSDAADRPVLMEYNDSNN